MGGSMATYLLTNREDWYFHHFALLLCGANVESAYALEGAVIQQLIESLLVFLKHSPSSFVQLNESVYLTSLLLAKLSKHFFHFFDGLDILEEKFTATNMEKMWSLMQ